ncbi:MAG: cyclic nucleotide-binding domain-containing protein [Bradymonadales bacterium]|nr:cyclic nucleotide-binding domain-containing protein [Bradymonadales bacterium]
MERPHASSAPLLPAIERVRDLGDLGQALALVADKLPDCVRCPGFQQQLGRLLEEANEIPLAIEVYQQLAPLALASNRPLIALDAIGRLHRLSQAVDTLLDRLSGAYSSSSERLIPGTVPRTAGCLLTRQLELRSSSVGDEQFLAQVSSSCSQSTDTGNDPAEGIGFSPIPILSDLDTEEFRQVSLALVPTPCQKGEILIQVGEQWRGVWWFDESELAVASPYRGTEIIEGSHLVLGLESLYQIPSEATITNRRTAQALFLPSQQLMALMQGSQPPGLAFQRAYHRGEIHHTIARCHLFPGLSKEDHLAIMSRVSGHQLSKGTTFVTQGRPSNGMFILVRGQASLTISRAKSHQQIAELSTGDVTGLLGIGPGESSPCSAVAQSELHVLFLDVDSLRWIIQHHPAIGGAVEMLQRELAGQILLALSG